ncbi:hypothetical protein [Paraferrimonas sp. SM1919]|uniref:hypothetical protein n=1 Tax=Paraferrimonas sp. SM1919 TaxID=2662263 RepID=UPI0013D08275
MHDLRRTTASHNVILGASIQSTSKLLGHRNIEVTNSTYAHLDTTTVRDDLARTVNVMLGDVNYTEKVTELVNLFNALPSQEQQQVRALI